MMSRLQACLANHSKQSNRDNMKAPRAVAKRGPGGKSLYTHERPYSLVTSPLSLCSSPLPFLSITALQAMTAAAPATVLRSRRDGRLTRLMLQCRKMGRVQIEVVQAPWTSSREEFSVISTGWVLQGGPAVPSFLRQVGLCSFWETVLYEISRPLR